MTRVLIIQEGIPHYRIPVFRALAKQFRLSVTSVQQINEPGFEVLAVELKRWGSFFHLSTSKVPKLSNFDVVIFTFNIRWLNLLIMALSPFRKYKLVVWGIGVSTETGFDSIKKWDWLRYVIARNSDAVIFYSDYPISRYITEGKVDKNNMFVAHNTLDLSPQYFDDPKEFFLFVGTLKKYKRVDYLIHLYAQAITIDPDIADLHIIGDGDYYEQMKNEIERQGIAHKVVFHGAINETEKLIPFYRRAIASISPAQAGLSVLQALSMGVPFVTMSDAITGGERLNIIHEQNGILADNDQSFIDALVELSNNRLYATKLGLNAYEYFVEQCSLNRMLDGFKQAINNVIEKK
jgi:glycosyltransferase involved in cell wall biosynthesis